MTDNQLQYKKNAKLSISLCLQLEQLEEESDYHEKALNYHSLEVLVMKMVDIKTELAVLWNKQVDLFFEIRDEFKSTKSKKMKDITDDIGVKIEMSHQNKSGKHAVNTQKPVNPKYSILHYPVKLMEGR